MYIWIVIKKDSSIIDHVKHYLDSWWINHHDKPSCIPYKHVSGPVRVNYHYCLIKNVKLVLLMITMRLVLRMYGDNS